MLARTLLTLSAVTLPLAAEAAHALRFYGNGAAAPGLDRVAIRLDAPARPIDVGQGDFTVEFWLKAIGAENGSYNCDNGNVSWIGGNIILDRDINGAADFGDWGVSLANGRIAFGVSQGSGGATACGATYLGDSQWHHVALTRRAASGQLRVYVNGQLDGSATGPTGNVSYRDGYQGSDTDPFLVIGAEKLDVGGPYPSYAGWLDELRVSTVDRYPANFTRPTAPFGTDPSTAALYHFDEGTGDVINDDSGAAGGPSQGVRSFGGSPPGPEWTLDTPFGDLIFADGFDTAGLAGRAAGSVGGREVLGSLTAGQMVPEAMVGGVAEQVAHGFLRVIRAARPERGRPPQP
jgi:hypothetical protein